MFQSMVLTFSLRAYIKIKRNRGLNLLRSPVVADSSNNSTAVYANHSNAVLLWNLKLRDMSRSSETTNSTSHGGRNIKKIFLPPC